MGVFGTLIVPGNREIMERTSPRYTAIIEDNDGDPVAGSSLTTLTLTLYNLSPDLAIINTRNKQNVLNANNVTIDGVGALVWEMQQLDTLIVGTVIAGQNEEHIGLFEGSHTGGSKHFKHEFSHFIRQLDFVP